MDQPATPPELSELSIAERILLVQDIWDSVAADSGVLELTEAQQTELGRRLAAYRNAPHEGSSWEDVKQRIQEAK